MKKFLSLFLLFLILSALLSLQGCVNDDGLDRITESFDSLTQSLGGKVIVFRPKDADVPKAVISLYGKAQKAPDELSLVDYAVIWYSDRLTALDAAVFRVTNATDTPSVIKMCRRRAETLRCTTGASVTVSAFGHFVYIYNDELSEFASDLPRP